jgi:fucose 4-O-acetylase-like acetyltransferase
MVNKPILYNIKIATGIAILLVVIGHLASRGESEIPNYVRLKAVIYKFHMPLFLFLSGYIAFYTYQPIQSYKDYFRFIKKKFFRLFPAYILLSLIFFGGKFILNKDIDVIDGFINILFFPSKGNSGFLWYIYVLFLYNLSMPLIVYAVKNKFILFLTLSISLSLLTFPSWLSLNFYFWYLPYFMLGCFLSNNNKFYNKILKLIGSYILLIFLFWGLLEYFELISLPKIIVSFISIIATCYLSSLVLKRNAFFEILGDNSFYIYLFNTMFIGGLSYVLIKFIGLDCYYQNFYLIAPLLVFLGIFLPIILYKYFIAKIPIINNWIK